MEASSRTTTLGRILSKSIKQPMPVLVPRCPRCDGAGLKAGHRQTRAGRIQRLFCRTCVKHFSESPIPGKCYSVQVILNALTNYHLGRTIAETRRELARRFRTQVPNSTIHSWLSHFAQLCTFNRLRKRYPFSEEETILSRTFSHKREYKFKFHRLKMNIFCRSQFHPIRRYLWHIADNCPNALFQNGGARCSDANLPNLRLHLLRRETNAVPLARLALNLAKNRRGRHEAIQWFMLANDSATVAVEVPVYLFPNEALDLQLTAPLTGHIDLLQVRGNRVWILDYKPDAVSETRAKFQLYLYARALSVRSGIPMWRFGLAYFDDRDYFEVDHSGSRS